MINFPYPLNEIFEHTDDLPVFFDRLMLGMVELLQCDRCYLYLRDPQLKMCQIAHCYCVHPEIPNLTQTNAETEPFYRRDTDPLFAAAIAGEPAIYIDNIGNLLSETANCYWQKNYGDHQALMQAHIILDGELWGIIQAANFNSPRPWAKFDKDIISLVVDKITPLVTVEVRRKLRQTVQVLHDGTQ